MKLWKKMSRGIVGIVIMVMFIMSFFTSCAYIFGGGAKKEHERSANIRWGYFLLDILGGVVPLVIDFATGAIYEPKEGFKSGTTKEIKEALDRGIPIYRVKKDGIYRAYVKTDGGIGYMRVSENELSPRVIENLKLALAK